VTDKIGILSNGGRAYFYIVRELTNLGVPFIESDEIKKLIGVNVILATVEVAPEVLKHLSDIKIFYLSEDILLEDAQIIILEAIYYSKRKNQPKNIIFGIDPGDKRFGFVCILDDVVIKKEIYRDSERVVREIKKLAEKIDFREKIYIFLGGGARVDDLNALKRLRRIDNKRRRIILKIVDENNSSKFGNDAAAAYFIALRGISRYIL